MNEVWNKTFNKDFLYAEKYQRFALVQLRSCYIAVYIFDMTPCESFLLTKNGSLKLRESSSLITHIVKIF